jgi:hypothetical protein
LVPRQSAWPHPLRGHAETKLFPKGRTKFIRPDGSVGRCPGHGVVLLGVGEVANDALRNSGLAFVVGGGLSSAVTGWTLWGADNIGTSRGATAAIHEKPVRSSALSPASFT